MHRRRYAKIVATLGPASSSSEMIRALFEAGADVFRFNFSHGTHDEHQARYDIVRAIGAFMLAAHVGANHAGGDLTPV
jgi:pyruvate kinase